MSAQLDLINLQDQMAGITFAAITEVGVLRLGFVRSDEPFALLLYSLPRHHHPGSSPYVYFTHTVDKLKESQKGGGEQYCVTH
jgi:hypothetical protein